MQMSGDDVFPEHHAARVLWFQRTEPTGGTLFVRPAVDEPSVTELSCEAPAEFTA